MSIVLNGTTGISSTGGYAGDGVSFADGTPANTLVTDASGNVGIGTSSPGGKLAVVTNANTQQWVALQNTNAGSSASNGVLFGNDANAAYGALYLNSSTNAGFGQASGMVLGTYASTALTFITGATERARIDSGGKFLIGLTTAYSDGTIGSPIFQWVAKAGQFVGAICVGDTTAGLGAMAFKNPNGLVGQITMSGSSTAYSTSSDYRLKEDITPMTGALARVAALKPGTYKGKADGSDGEGFIAHELAEVCPSAVHGEKDAVDADGKPQYQGIDVSFLIGTLTAAIQEQQAIITALTARVEAVEAK